MIAADPMSTLSALDLSAVVTLAIGGFVNHRKPITLMRALGETAPTLQPSSLVCLSASVDLDLALSIWPTITTVHCPFQGVEGIAAISPLLEHRLKQQQVTAPPWDTGLLSLALRTPPGQEAQSIAGVGTDLPTFNPMLREHEGTIRIAGLSIDLALLHVPQATADGDIWYDDSPWGDGLFLDHAKHVIATIGAIAPATPTARIYSHRPVWTLLSLEHPTAPTADPPRCEADLNELRRMVTDRKHAQA